MTNDPNKREQRVGDLLRSCEQARNQMHAKINRLHSQITVWEQQTNKHTHSQKNLPQYLTQASSEYHRYSEQSPARSVTQTNNFFKSPIVVANPNHHILLPPPKNPYQLCLVLDLDETLIHTNFGRQKQESDFTIALEGQKLNCKKRPHLSQFLQSLRPHFEIVLFTASMAKYAEPLIAKLDFQFDFCLFRESCTKVKQNGQDLFVKDLSRLGRDLKRVILVDNSPFSYLFHPKNGLPCTSWFSSESDCELLQILQLLEHCATLKPTEDVRAVLSQFIVRGKLVKPPKSKQQVTQAPAWSTEKKQKPSVLKVIRETPFERTPLTEQKQILRCSSKQSDRIRSLSKYQNNDNYSARLRQPQQTLQTKQTQFLVPTSVYKASPHKFATLSITRSQQSLRRASASRSNSRTPRDINRNEAYLQYFSEQKLQINKMTPYKPKMFI